MAMLSKVAWPAPGSPSQSTGTKRVGESVPMLRAQSSESNLTMRSLKGMPNSVMASQGRSDQEE